MCSTSLLPTSSPLRKLEKSVKPRTPAWRPWGSSKQRGGMASTGVITGGCWTPAFVTLWLWPGPSVEVVYLGWEPCIVLRTRQASLPLIADLMPTALNVSVWYLLKHSSLKKKKKASKACNWCSTSHWNDSMSCIVCTEWKQFSDSQKQGNETAVIWLKQVRQMVFREDEKMSGKGLNCAALHRTCFWALVLY